MEKVLISEEQARNMLLAVYKHLGISVDDKTKDEMNAILTVWNNTGYIRNE